MLISKVTYVLRASVLSVYGIILSNNALKTLIYFLRGGLDKIAQEYQVDSRIRADILRFMLTACLCYFL